MRQQEARGKVVIQSPSPNLQIMAYAPKRVSFGIKAFKAFWEILKNKALTIWGSSAYEALGQSAPFASLSLRAWFLRSERGLSWTVPNICAQLFTPVVRIPDFYDKCDTGF